LNPTTTPPWIFINEGKKRRVTLLGAVGLLDPLVYERLGEYVRGWVNLREVGLACDRLGAIVRGWVSEWVSLVG
jgi:hypothetical protein